MQIFLLGRQDLESSPDVVMGILYVFSTNVHVLIDALSSLSYITLFVAHKDGQVPELLCHSFEVSMPISEPVIAIRIYRGCDVMIYDRHSFVEMSGLEMVEFDVIMELIS